MNKYQKNTLITVAILLGLMLLFPPFQRSGIKGGTFGLGYSFIFSPPKAYATINAGTLFIQYLIVTSIGAGLFFVFREFKKNPVVSKQMNTQELFSNILSGAKKKYQINKPARYILFVLLFFFYVFIHAVISDFNKKYQEIALNKARNSGIELAAQSAGFRAAAITTATNIVFIGAIWIVVLATRKK